MNYSEITDRKARNLCTTPRPVTSMTSSIYYSLDQVLATLCAPEILKFPQVQLLLRRSEERGIVVKVNNNFHSNMAATEPVTKNSATPFIVVEGLDGSGKTFLTNCIREHYHMALMQTPPTVLKEVRNFFDDQPEGVKRAFYSLGNYWAARDVMESKKPVIMDRFWHSTAAYAVGNYLKNLQQNSGCKSTHWPQDLLQPNLVIFLVVSESERLRRHSARQEFTNTVEEQTLAKDEAFRQNVVGFYKNIQGPTLVEINADGQKEEVKRQVFQCINEIFPGLEAEAKTP